MLVRETQQRHAGNSSNFSNKSVKSKSLRNNNKILDRSSLTGTSVGTWKIDNDVPYNGGTANFNPNQSIESALGSDFALAIASIAQGIGKESKKVYPPFKKAFFEETMYNPPIGNTHICYEYDAQFSEMDRRWAKPGKKFSEEPRISPLNTYGPIKNDDITNFFEKPKKIFGRRRAVGRPFEKAQQYSRNRHSANVPYKPTHDEEYSHLGPGTYSPYPDVFTEDNKPICGNTRGRESAIFKSNTPKVKYEKVDLTLKESKSFPNTPNTLYKQYNRPSTTVGIHGIRDSNDSSNSLRNITASPPRTAQTRQLMHELGSVPSIDGHVPENDATKIRPQTVDIPLKIKSREPGFAFLKGPMPRSCLSIVTGTTGADITFRRVLLKNGEEVIMSFGSEKTLTLPEGAKYMGGWGQSQVFAEKDEVLSLIEGKRPISNNNNNNNNRNKNIVLNEKDDVLMPPISPIKLTMSSALPMSSLGSKGLRSPQSFEFKAPIVPRKNEFEINRDTEIVKKKIGINALNDLREKSIASSVDIADKCPVSTSPSNSVVMKVRKIQRGGGDTIGTHRAKTPLAISMTQQTLASISNSIEFDTFSINDSIISSMAQANMNDDLSITTMITK